MLLHAPGRTHYIEPMVGGASVACQMVPHFEHARLGDNHVDLILMWQAVMSGWLPPESVDRDTYNELRAAEPSALRGFVGYVCSYGGKWFGGYMAPTGPRPLVPGGENPAAQGVRSLQRKMPKLRGAWFTCCDYRDWAPEPGSVIYLDPPYGGVQHHRGEAFDIDRLWQTARTWADRGVSVFVSEYKGASGFEPIWEGKTPRKIEGNRGLYQTERLWVPT